MPYSGDPEGVARDEVRLLVGDLSTSTSGEFLTDEAYDWFVNETPNRYIAAQHAANSLAAKFTGAAASASGDGYIEKTVGDLKIRKADAVSAAAQYKSMAAQFGRQAAANIVPYAGGQSISDKASVVADSDRVAPPFVSGMFDNPNATTFGGSVST